jgi:uncharacterized surface protein with fasciclin (FAS1) repeats
MKDNKSHRNKYLEINMKSYRKILIRSTLLLFVILGFGACEQKPKEPDPTNEELVMSQYIAKEKNFSEFDGLLKITGLDNLLGIRGPYSLFLPNNDAMFAYYKSKGISSYTDLDSLSRRELVLNHVIGREYSVSDFQLGTLGQKNALGDNMVTEFPGVDILINKVAKIVKRDVRVSNGTIQIIDAVLEPVKLSVFDILANNPSYSIFTEGLVRTGLKDTLQNITFRYGKGTARSRFTILAIADTTFNRLGINTIDDLVNKYTSDPANLTSPDNGFYQYMDFHCLDKNAYYTSEFVVSATLYSVLSKNNNVQIRKVNNVIQINLDSANKFTGIYKDQSNIPGKNGVIHTIDKLLPVTIAPATTLIWEVTDYFDFKQGEYYLKHFEKFYDTAQFEGIRWEGLYLQYYIKAAKDAFPELNEDCLNMMNFWKIEVTTPKIMKGKYQLGGRVQNDLTMSFAVYIDGVQTNIWKASETATIKSHSSEDTAPLFDFGIVDWPTTTTHKIKLVSLNSGTLFWDRVEFTPVTGK